MCKDNMGYSVVVVFGMHLYNCVVPLVANSLQSGQVSAKLTASVHVSLGSRVHFERFSSR